ncbi:MAG: PilZ domain-containing protein [Vicinamibacteria bacterium]|nr:PilZ domain-containing protein [Vicinamibacteria bacterium]
MSGENAGERSFAEQTRSLNVSAGGILFASRQKLVVGSRVRLRIDIPYSLRKHFGGRTVYETRAVICRIEPVEGSELMHVGARFLPGRRS